MWISRRSDTQFGRWRTLGLVEVGQPARLMSDTDTEVWVLAQFASFVVDFFFVSLLRSLLAAHRLAFQRDPVSTVYQAVEDRILKGGIPYQFVPVLEGELAGHESGAAAVAILDDFQHVTPFAVAEQCQVPVIQYQEVRLR